jgi:hypothetical protein
MSGSGSIKMQMSLFQRLTDCPLRNAVRVLTDYAVGEFCRGGSASWFRIEQWRSFKMELRWEGAKITQAVVSSIWILSLSPSVRI